MHSTRVRLGLIAGLFLLLPAPMLQAAPQTDTDKRLDAFMDVFERVRADYVDKVDDKKLIEGAINGMLASLDPHSSYLNAKDNANMKEVTDGEYGGLGLTVSTEEGAVKVIAPTDDTPAARAGIKAGDFITRIDNTLLYGLTLTEAVDKMRGAAGTTVKLTVIREGAPKPLEFTLTREVIKIRPVKWEVKGDAGVIRIASFSKSTGPDTRAAIAGIEHQLGPKLAGFIIDLRSDPGGLLDQSIDVADAFLDHGEIVSQRGRTKNDIERYYAKGGDLTHGKPIVVLIDAGTASAAEIVAGALQDQKRALILGQRSFGKGSVQTLIPLDADTALRLTTARYFTPSGRSVQENGIEPDITVPQLSDPLAADASRPRLREADLQHHLINEVKADDKLIEADDKPDPRFADTSDALKKKGVTDYQLTYAVKLIDRLADGPAAVQTAATTPPPAATVTK